MVLVTLMVFLSVQKIRELMYEVFLFVHKLFSALLIVLMVYHVNQYGWMGWIWSLIGIWGFDVVIRVLRIVVNGGFHRVKVEIAEHRVVRLVISNPHVHYFPGCHCFFYFLSPKYGQILQSHPFTVIKSPVEENGNLVVYLKARGGVTQRLYYGNDTEVLAFIEGPYGEFGPEIFKEPSYKPIVLPEHHKLASQLDESLDIVDKAQSQVLKHRNLASKLDESILDNLSEEPASGDVTIGLAAGMVITAVLLKLFYCRTQAKLYWVVNDINSVNWIYRELEWLKQQGCFVKIIVTDELVTEKAIAELKSYCSLVVVALKAQPRVAGIVNYNAERYAHVDFVVCGPVEFNYAVRDALGERVYSNVDLQMESFGW